MRYYCTNIDITPELHEEIINTLQNKFAVEFTEDKKFDPNVKALIVDMEKETFLYYHEKLIKQNLLSGEEYCDSLNELYEKSGVIINHCKIIL